MKLFLDLDGVFADFDAHVHALFGFQPRSVPDDVLWARVEETPDFWLDMPVKHGAHDLWAVAAPHNPSFLTGCPATGFERASAHKKQWVATHFSPSADVITCRSRDKQKHMTAPGDVLLDDFVANIKRWEKAGGRPIYYRNPHQALAALKEVLGHE